MKASTLVALASLALGGAIWSAIYVSRPGSHALVALGGGCLTVVTIRLILAAAHAERREEAQRQWLDGGKR